MTETPREISRQHILAPEVYAAERGQRRKDMIEVKKNRRLAVGPDATFYFENFETMLAQVHEMLHTEGGGEAQIESELEAYNPLVPKGRELVATFMIEIADEDRRRSFLATAGGIELSAFLRVGGEVIAAVPEEDVERTSATGKASSVHFLHFPFSDDQVARFRDGSEEIVLGLGHETYAHMAVLPAAVRAALARDFA